MVVAQRDTGFRRQVGLQLSQHARLALQEVTGSNHPVSEGAHRRANQGYAQPMTGRYLAKQKPVFTALHLFSMTLVMVQLIQIDVVVVHGFAPCKVISSDAVGVIQIVTKPRRKIWP
jgi:hypothetical protein